MSKLTIKCESHNSVIQHRRSSLRFKAPLIVLEVVDFDMRSFGITRIAQLDPTGEWAASCKLAPDG